MCQILKMTYNSGNVIVEVASRRELTNCVFELYLYDFLRGGYDTKANIEQVISSLQLSQDSGIYSFRYSIPGNCMAKCVISDGGNVIASRERYIGDRQKIRISVESSEFGDLYKIKSEMNISRKLIFYKSPVSSTKINLPDDLRAGETLMFTIKEREFRPKFESYPEFAECFSIEW